MEKTATSAPEHLRQRQAEIRLTLRGLDQAIDNQRNHVGKLRYRLSQGRSATPSELDVLESAERELATLQNDLSAQRSELDAVSRELHALDVAARLEQARQERTERVAALSASTGEATAQALSAAETTLTSVRAAHEDLLTRVSALKSKADSQPDEIRRNAREHAQALARGEEPPALIPRIDYAAVLTECSREVEASEKRVATAEKELSEAQRVQSEAQASEVYSRLHAALAPFIDDLLALPAVPASWSSIMAVHPGTPLQINLYPVSV